MLCQDLLGFSGVTNEEFPDFAPDFLAIDMIADHAAETSGERADATKNFFRIPFKLDDFSIGENVQETVDRLGMNGRFQEPSLPMIAQNLELLVVEFVGGEVVRRL